MMTGDYWLDVVSFDLKDHRNDRTKIDSWKNFIREHQMQKISNQIASV